MVSAPAPISAEPQTTTASYGDWVVRCVRVDASANAERVCEAAQAIQAKGQTAAVAQLAMGKPLGSDVMHVTTVVPTNILLGSSVHLVTGDKIGLTVELVWRRCLPGGCFADATPKDETVRAWRGQTELGRITYKDGAGRDVAIPFSFRGLAQALDALAKS